MNPLRSVLFLRLTLMVRQRYLDLMRDIRWFDLLSLVDWMMNYWFVGLDLAACIQLDAQLLR